MKKKICLALMLIFSYFILLNGNMKVIADSGWDGDYDSGSGWDSDYSYANDYNYSGSSAGEGNAEPLFAFLVILFYIIFIIGVAIIINKLAERTTKTIYRSDRNQNYIAKDFKIAPLSPTIIRKVLPDYNREELKRELYNIYKDIQFAWMNFDYDTLKQLTTDELYNMYKNQLMTLKLKNGKNIMENFELLDYEVVGINNYKDKIEIVIGLLVACNDYVIDINTNKVTRGNKERTVTYNYQITFVKSKDLSKTNNCPNCGAALESINSNTCNYCKSSLISKNHDWIMSKKENRGQF